MLATLRYRRGFEGRIFPVGCHREYVTCGTSDVYNESARLLVFLKYRAHIFLQAAQPIRNLLDDRLRVRASKSLV